MLRRGLGLAVLAAGLCFAGCRLHVQQIRINQPLSEDRYRAIVLGESTRRDVLALLGPPDEARYTPSELVFDYWTASHRGNDLELVVPSNLIPGFDPLGVVAVPRFFFDPFVESEEFQPSFLERAGRDLTKAALRSVPCRSGQGIVQLHGRQIRLGRLRVVFDLETLSATQKALRLATGNTQRESFAEQIMLLND